MRLFFSILTLLLVSFSSQATNIIIIIDDMGNNLIQGQQALTLPSPINFAFLPHTPQAPTLAKSAFKSGHGVMLHAPMDNITHQELGPGGLYEHMNQDEIQHTFLHSLRSIPYVQGFNNHMGSLLTQNNQIMQWIMDAAAQEDVFFIDSLTSAKSVAARQAKQKGIANLTRDVFLDNDRTFESIDQQFLRAIQIARHKGYAVVIGHPYPETIDYLQAKLPAFISAGLKLHKLDDFLGQGNWQAFQLKRDASSKFLLR